MDLKDEKKPDKEICDGNFVVSTRRVYRSVWLKATLLKFFINHS